MNKIITHQDLDGVVSAVLLSKKFKIKQVIYSSWLKESKKHKIDKNTIISDLDLDPRCRLWFDHHISNTPTHHFRGSFALEKSCARVIFNYFNGKFSEYYKDLVEKTDKADSASFTLKEVQNPSSIYWLNMIGFIYPFKNIKQQHTFLHKLFLYFNKETPLKEIIHNKEIQDLIQNLKKSNLKSLKFIAKTKQTRNHTLIVELGKKEVDNLLLSTKYPNMKYIILIKSPKNKKRLSLLLFKNLYNKSKSSSNIGKILNKIGGGGHKDIGGCQINKKEKDKIVKLILKRLSQ